LSLFVNHLINPEEAGQFGQLINCFPGFFSDFETLMRPSTGPQVLQMLLTGSKFVSIFSSRSPRDQVLLFLLNLIWWELF